MPTRQPSVPSAPDPLLDKDALTAALSSAFLFVCATNAECATLALSRSPHGSPPNAVKQVRDRLERDPSDWGMTSPICRAFMASDVLTLGAPRDVLDAVSDVVLNEAAVARGNDRSEVTSRFVPPITFSERVALHETDDGIGYSWKRRHKTPVQRNTCRVLIWDPLYDPLSIVEGLAIGTLGSRDSLVDHVLQRWIRGILRLSFDETSKLLLQIICERLNLLFYDERFPRRSRVHSERSPTVDARVLFDELRRAILASGLTPSPRTLLGLYLLLRFNRTLRVRYVCVSPAQPPAISTRYEDALGTPSCPTLAVSSRRPFEFSHMKVRLFGALTGVQGLNAVFRGGILPRTHTGHTLAVRGRAGAGKSTLALHLVADMACRGRLGVYCCFEENWQSVADRLAIFDMVDPRLCDVHPFTAQIAQQLKIAHDAGKGVLLLLAVGSGGTSRDPFSWLRIINEQAHGLERFEKWKGIVFDSVDALEIDEAAGPSPLRDSRTALRSLTAAVEAERFWGIFIAEADQASHTLEYLADTAIEVGHDTASSTRTIAITKSRMQETHVGPHTIRMREGRGVRVYPSLASVQSGARQRVTTTLSHERVIRIAGEWGDNLRLSHVREKSATLIRGPAGSGKTRLLLELLTTPATSLDQESGRRHHPPPQSVLLVTFRTSERRLEQSLQSRTSLRSSWLRVPSRTHRWIAPGEQFDASQFIDDLTVHLRDAERFGSGLTRVAFDEIDAIEEFLPRMAASRGLWPTVLQLLASEAVTAVFATGDRISPHALGALETGSDYILQLASPISGSVIKVPMA